MSQKEKCSVLEMIGEFLRELAVLIFVFVPLELWKGNGSDQRQFIWIVVWTVTLALCSLTMGVVLERKRP